MSAMERQHCVAVLLYFTYTSALSNGIRLVGFSNNCAGRVELSKGERVCGQDWGLKQAGVVCRELRCDKAVATGGSAFGSKFGSGSGSVWLKEVHCRGTEGALSQCGGPPPAKNTTCPQGDAQVVCARAISTPVISMQPASDVNWGESLTIRCEIPDDIFQLTEASLKLNKNSVTQETEKGLHKGLYSAKFTLAKVKFEDEGVYECCYEQENIELCSPMNFTVTVDLQVPNISAFSSDQQQWSQSGVQVTRGQHFVIDCSTSACSPEGQFVLSFPGSNSSITELSLNHSASFHFPESQQQHQGLYRCVFQITGAGRTYTSPTSTRLMVTVKQPLLPIILPTVAVSLLLLISTAFYFCRRRRRRRVTKLVTSTPALNTMTTMNRYEESDDEEEDDYVNAPGGKNEDSSEEPDYVNVEEVNDRCTVDIYGADNDNIYENL